MEHTLTLPPRRELRATFGTSIAAWARGHGHPAASVHVIIGRYAGSTVDMTRTWGPQTRAILLDLGATVHESKAA